MERPRAWLVVVTWYWFDLSPEFFASSFPTAEVGLQMALGVASSSWLGVLPSGKLTGRELVTELDGRELAQFCEK